MVSREAVIPPGDGLLDMLELVIVALLLAIA